MTGASQRTYAGTSSEDRVLERRRRLIEAGLESLGTVGASGTTVRSVIERSGLAPRYFYESFDSLDDLQVAVFDQVIVEVESTALCAMDAAPRRPRLRIRAVIEALTELLLDDPRKGRVVLVESLSTPALGPRRARASQRFAALLAASSQSAWHELDDRDPAITTTALFATGGFGEILTGQLMGQLAVDHDVLVDDLTELFLGTGVAIREIARRRG